ncbi:MAG: glutaredoxin family protein [Anaerolineae bacterium]
MFCQSVKEFLSQNGIAYEEKDVSANEAALHELMHMGVFTTPATVIDGEVVVGFDRKRLAELLGVE